MKVAVGDDIPEWRAEVGPEPMKTVAALLRDPNPIHWDVTAVTAAGLGDKPINQGPVNLAYLMNMLIAWLGDPACVRTVRVRFRANVYAGDTVRALGAVTALDPDDDRLAECEIRLERDGDVVVAGTAVVRIPE